MKTRQKILPAVCCISLLSACASNQPVSVAPWSIKPMTAMNSNDKPEAMYQIGRYYQGQNRYDQAIDAYKKTLAADSSFVEARNGLGVIYSRQGKYNEAIEVFKIAIQQAPKAAHLYSNIGYAYYLQGLYAESVTALVQATTLDPTNQRALNNLGLAYAKVGSNIESIQAFSHAASQAVMTSVATPSLGQSSLPETVAVAEPVKSAEVNAAAASQPELQMLALPKDRGAITPAFIALTLPVVESRVKLVRLEPNVYELHMQQPKVAPIPMAMIVPVVAASDNSSVAKTRVEIANGNGVAGMARKVGRFLRSQGYPEARLTNQKPFQARMTQIQYRDGHQAEAQLLKASLPEAPELVQRNDMRADIGVRLVLGKDVATGTAYFDGKFERVLLALN